MNISSPGQLASSLDFLLQSKRILSIKGTFGPPGFFFYAPRSAASYSNQILLRNGRMQTFFLLWWFILDNQRSCHKVFGRKCPVDALISLRHIWAVRLWSMGRPLFVINSSESLAWLISNELLDWFSMKRLEFNLRRIHLFSWRRNCRRTISRLKTWVSWVPWVLTVIDI